MGQGEPLGDEVAEMDPQGEQSQSDPGGIWRGIGRLAEELEEVVENESGAIHLLEEGANSRGGEGVGGKDAEVLEEAEGAFGFVDGDEFGHGAESLGWLGSGGERRERGLGRGRGWSGLGRKVGGNGFG